jgi:hypothetical protein
MSLILIILLVLCYLGLAKIPKISGIVWMNFWVSFLKP